MHVSWTLFVLILVCSVSILHCDDGEEDEDNVREATDDYDNEIPLAKSSVQLPDTPSNAVQPSSQHHPRNHGHELEDEEDDDEQDESMYDDDDEEEDDDDGYQAEPTTDQPSQEPLNNDKTFKSVMVKVYRGPTTTVKQKPFAPWSYFIKFPT